MINFPRWGLTCYVHDQVSGTFVEEDFQLISELGFGFARLPMSYRRKIIHYYPTSPVVVESFMPLTREEIYDRKAIR
jgi:hypothetical protein